MNSRTLGSSHFDNRLYLPEAPNTQAPTRMHGELYRIVRRNRLLILAVFIFCLLAAFAVSALQTPVYRGEALIEVQGLNANFMKASEYQPLATDGRTADAFLATQIRLLKSEAVATKVVESTHLNENALYFRTNDKMRLLKQALRQAPAPERETVADTARRLAHGLTVTAVGDSDLISIKVDAPDAQLAAALSNAMATEYIERRQQERLDTSVQTSSIMTDQLEDFRIRLQNSERELQNYAKSAGLLFTDEHSMATDEQLRLVQADLAKAQADRAEKEAERHLLTTATPESLPKVLDDGPLRDLNSKLTDLRRQLAELSTTLTPKNYKVETIQAEIMAVEAAISRERANVVLRIQNEYAASSQREELLREAYQNQAKIVTNDSAKAVRYNVLKREVDANRDLYGSMLQKVKEASVLSALHTSSLRLVDAAQPPLAPYRPNYLMNAGFGTMAGLFCAMLLVLGRERIDRTLRRRGEMAGVLEVPELGAIPSTLALGGRNSLALTTSRGESPNSFFAEAFNCTATSIASTPQTCKVFLITSPHPRDGKSTVVANLGRALARSGRRGILVDGDLRQPSLHSIFSCGRSPGLAEMLRGEATVATTTVAGDPPVNGSIPALNLIAAGNSNHADWSLLQSAGMEKLLQELRRQYDFVLIDSPPMLQLTDARILARLADAVVLVCRAGKTRPEQVLEAARLLALDGSALVGTILNDWNPKAEDPEYFKGYSSYYN